MLVDPPGSRDAILPLPIAALRLPPNMAASLRVQGFERIGELLAQLRAPLSLRFGSEFGRRFDQAIGRATELIDPIHPPEPIEVRRAFAEPIVAAETIARDLGKLVAQLAARRRGARHRNVLVRRVDNHDQAVRIGTARPVPDPCIWSGCAATGSGPSAQSSAWGGFADRRQGDGRSGQSPPFGP